MTGFPPTTVRRAQAGFTMIEMIIATMMLMVLSFLVTNMIISGNAAQKYSDRLGRVTEITQEIVDDMRRELRAGVRIFENNALGTAYASMIAPWPGITPIASTVLPTIRPTGSFERDVVGTEKTGNALLFARHGWADSFTCTSGATYRVDVYRLVAYYMRLEGTGPVPRYPWGLNLVKWTSEPMVNGSQLDAISVPADRAEFAQHLLNATPDDAGETHSALNLVWKLGGDPAVAGTFRQIMTDGSLSATPQSPRTGSTWQFERADNLSSAGLLFYRHHSLASNYAQDNQGVARFGIRNDATSGIGFPHGLEFQVIGSASARQILIHLTTVSTNMMGLKAYYDSQVVIVLREG